MIWGQEWHIPTEAEWEELCNRCNCIWEWTSIDILPDRIDEYTDGAVTDNGYDYLDNDVMALWLETEDAAGNVGKVIELIESEAILENDLKKAAVVYISEEDCAEIEQCKKVYPER